MGFWDNLGNTALTTLKQSTANAIADTYAAQTDVLDLFGIASSNNPNMKKLYSADQSIDNFTNNLTSTLPKANQVASPETFKNEMAKNDAFYNYINADYVNNKNPDNARGHEYPTKSGKGQQKWGLAEGGTEGADILSFKVPDWGYADFINERAIWQKSLYSGTSEPGWFYFKIFFNFDTQYGLFGGLLNDADFRAAANSAAKYLYFANGLYTHERCNDRIIALHKFASILSFINTNAPWFFKSISGLNTLNSPQLSDFSKQKSIEIECNNDAVDMRLSTMLDLYKFAAYDDMNCKEIIPENLRKFDMSIILFQAPIRYYHTSMQSKTRGKFDYKTLSTQYGMDKTMSFKMYTLINCEISKESLGVMTPSNVSNEKPFTLGHGTLRINYDRVYTHTMNEFNEILFGSDGFYYDGLQNIRINDVNYNSSVSHENKQQRNRYKAMQDSLSDYESYGEANPESFKSLVDASEALCSHNLIKLGGNALGNVAGMEQIKHFDSQGNFITDDNILGHDKTRFTDYFNYKLKRLKNFAEASRPDLNMFQKMGASYLLGLLGSSYDVMSSRLIKSPGDPNRGYLGGHGNVGITRTAFTGNGVFDYQRSQYFVDKLETLKKKNSPGVVNFSTLPQNRIYVYQGIKPLGGDGDVWANATATDLTLKASIKDTNITHIAGAKELEQIIHKNGKVIYTEYFKQKLRQLHGGNMQLNKDSSRAIASTEPVIEPGKNTASTNFAAKLKNLYTK